jgi:hypothetical protein
MKKKLAALALAALAISVSATLASELSPTKSHDVACPIFMTPRADGGCDDGGGGGGGVMWGLLNYVWS